MEQTPSSPGRSPELPSVSPPSAGEVAGVSPDSERKAGNPVELREQRSETVSQAEQIAAPAAPPIVVPAPASTPADDSADDTSQPATDSPTTANDDDLIEKEWVEKAKKIITATKDDPYRREQEVSRLQADYLLKRYGRSVGSLQ